MKTSRTKRMWGAFDPKTGRPFSAHDMPAQARKAAATASLITKRKFYVQVGTFTYRRRRKGFKT